MISAEHLRNIAKKLIKLPKKTLQHGNVLNTGKIRTYQDLSSQADPARENWTWSYSYFN